MSAEGNIAAACICSQVILGAAPQNKVILYKHCRMVPAPQAALGMVCVHMHSSLATRAAE